MGRPKQSLPYHGSTLAAAVTRTLLNADVSGVVVVTRTQLIDQLRLPSDPRVRVATNNAESEMIDSVRIGLVALQEARAGDDDGVLVVPADMPTLSTHSCRACIAAYTSNPGHIVIASYRGTRGHPIVFPFAMRQTVDSLKGGLRMLPRVCPEQVLFADADESAIKSDIDTPQDYDRL